jgi:arabinan endo-1,5-alpha-L-arabinosidase
MFMSYGGLADGGVTNDYNNGGYQMRVFRSEKPDGPYKDTNDISAIYNNYQLNFGPNAVTNRGVNILGAYTSWGEQTKGINGERSQGHNSIIAAEDGRTYLVYHTRFQNRNNAHEVRVHQMYQNKDGWLVAAPFEYSGEELTSAEIATTQQVSVDRIPGTYQLLTHKYKLDHTKKETVEPVEVTLTADKKITGGVTGTWAYTAGTCYVNFVIGGTAYRGVMVEQTLEPTDTKTIAFTGVALKTGVTVWAYQTAAENPSGISIISVDEKTEGRMYDLLGRRVNNPQRKGIYIQNGKKYIVK